MGLRELDEILAAREASDCGETERTGVLCPQQPAGGLAARTFETSSCDCMVIRIDSADVIQPLATGKRRSADDLIILEAKRTCKPSSRSNLSARSLISLQLEPDLKKSRNKTRMHLSEFLSAVNKSQSAIVLLLR